MNDMLNYKNYYGAVHYSSDDEVFFGKILAINDLVTFEGDTVKALKTAFEEAVDDYLQTCQEIGKLPDKTYKGTFNVRLSTELHKQSALFAAMHNITLNDFVKKALAFALSRKDPAELDRHFGENHFQHS